MDSCSYKVVSIEQGKGGGGKSVLISHAAYRACEKGNRVLIVDMDKNASTSMNFIPNYEGESNHNAYNLIYSNDSIKPTRVFDGLDIIPASTKLQDLDVDSNFEIFFQLKDRLRQYDGKYDYIFIDTSGHLGVGVICTLVASDYCMIPMEMQKYCIRTTNDTLELIEKVKTRFNNKLVYMGVLFNKIDSAGKSQNEIEMELKNLFGVKCLGRISKAVSIPDALDNNMPVWKYPNRNKKAAQEMLNVLDTVFNRIEG